jgi:hypothetical protein
MCQGREKGAKCQEARLDRAVERVARMITSSVSEFRVVRQKDNESRCWHEVADAIIKSTPREITAEAFFALWLCG